MITVVYNSERTIARCLESIIGQSYRDIEIIVVDGGSTDNTIDEINRYKNKISQFVSEPDAGIFDAMNKGISLATGEILGTLNSDDVYASNDTIQDITMLFRSRSVDAVYGNLIYVNSLGNVIRTWITGMYKTGDFENGWMPPHPSFYCRRQLFNDLGNFKLDFGTAADYELMLRFIHSNHLNVVYLNKIVVKMQIGGASNNSLTNMIRVLYFDLNAMRVNGIKYPFYTMIKKKFRKIGQYFQFPLNEM